MQDENGHRGPSKKREKAKAFWREQHAGGAPGRSISFWLAHSEQAARIQTFDLVCLMGQKLSPEKAGGSQDFWGWVIGIKIPDMSAPGIGVRVFSVEEIPLGLTPERAIAETADPYPVEIFFPPDYEGVGNPKCPEGRLNNRYGVSVYDLGIS